MQIPQTLTAGDSWSWVDSLPDYSSATYTLTYYLRGPTGLARLSIAAVGSGTNYTTSASAATTSALPTGNYEWYARIAGGSVSTTLGSGLVQVLGNPARFGDDIRTHNRKVFDALEAVIENRATTDQLSLSIAGRSISRMSWDEILKAYDRFKLAVAKELGQRPSRVLIRTSRA